MSETPIAGDKCDVCKGTGLDPSLVEPCQECGGSGDAPTLEITVLISKKVFEAALVSPPKWQALWGELIHARFLAAALDLKGFVANGFKPIADSDQMRAVKKKVAELEAPLPRIIIPKKGLRGPGGMKLN